MTVLFSPIGTRDPISNFHDGAMLHILRHNKPDKVILYFSAFILKKHKEDNRYLETINWLGEDIDHQFEIEIIERPELWKVDKYDYFYSDFDEILEETVKNNPRINQIYLNISSGTPAMTQALSVLSVLKGDLYTQVQVSKPEMVDQTDKDLHVVDYQGIKTYEDNLDNDPDGALNRCNFPHGNFLVFRIQPEFRS